MQVGTITVAQFQKLGKLCQESQLTEAGICQLFAENGLPQKAPGEFSKEDADQAIAIMESFLKGDIPEPTPAGVLQLEDDGELDPVEVLRAQMNNTLTVMEHVLKQHGQLIGQIQMLASAVTTLNADLRNCKHNVTRLEGEVRKVADSVRGK